AFPSKGFIAAITSSRVKSGSVAATTELTPNSRPNPKKAGRSHLHGTRVPRPLRAAGALLSLGTRRMVIDGLSLHECPPRRQFVLADLQWPICNSFTHSLRYFHVTAGKRSAPPGGTTVHHGSAHPPLATITSAPADPQRPSRSPPVRAPCKGSRGYPGLSPGTLNANRPGA